MTALPVMKVFKQAPGRVSLKPESIPHHLDEAWHRAGGPSIQTGESVAVAVGSRGIANAADIVEAVIEMIRRQGGEPFLVPAMGSHGSATAEGQAELLARMGLTRVRTACDIRPSMNTDVLAEVPVGGGVFPLHFSSEARAADRVVVVNRIKVHPRFAGDYESGLMKMLLVGLGKKAGASAVHRLCPHVPFDVLVRTAGPVLLRNVSVAFGVAIIENAHHETCRIECVPGERILEAEPALLLDAKSLTPVLPLPEVDLLVVDHIGKDVAGTGMDPYVIGLRADSPTRVTRIVVLDLTDATAGNAHGIGFADYTTRRVWDKIDLGTTQTNAMTAGRPEGARLPIGLQTDRDAVEAGLQIIQTSPARVVHIRNTADLRQFRASEALWTELRRAPALSEGASCPLAFDPAGILAWDWD